MLVLRLGLVLAAAAFVYVAWASWSAGYPTEVAMTRGVLAFMAATVLAYIGETVVATAPPPRARQDAGATGERTADAQDIERGEARTDETGEDAQSEQTERERAEELALAAVARADERRAA